MDRPVSFGTHSQFVGIYEFFLDAVYPPAGHDRWNTGRWRLAQSVAAEIRERKATQILDCAAGTGFPGLDLRLHAYGATEIHCCDGDQDMVNRLARQARAKGIPLDRITPPRRSGLARPLGARALVIGWAELDVIDRRYDYILCRGNSLAYADTWSGGHEVARMDRIRGYLIKMIDRLRPGGHLHVDAPWVLEVPETNLRLPSHHAMSLWEEVDVFDDHREWIVSTRSHHGGHTQSFRRFSSLLTIHEVEKLLKSLGLERTEPFQLAAERRGFGTIIARKPASGASTTAHQSDITLV